MSTPQFFSVEKHDRTLVVSPTGDMSSLEAEAVQIELDDILILLREDQIPQVIVDLTEAPFFGSTMLGSLIQLWRQLKDIRGRMCLCNLSDFHRDVLKITRLDSVWPTFDSRAAAIEYWKIDDRH